MDTKKQKYSNFEEYLSNIHANLITPDETIYGAVREATHETPISKNRIVAGESNEVYDVALKNNSHAIVRISRKGKAEFEREKWAIEKCMEVDIPVPQILLLKNLRVDKEVISICVQEKLPGEGLERGSIDYHNLNKEYVRKIILRAGEILSKIHSVKTTGFDYINGKGKGKFKNIDEFISKKVNRKEQFLKLAKREDFDTKLMEKILNIIINNLNKHRQTNPCLNNGDYAPKHIMVKGEKITGILDWGEASSNFPVYDFARWDYWFSEELPLDWLKEGYLNKELFNEDFENDLYCTKLDIGLDVLSWYSSQNYARAVENAKKKLLRDLEFFK